MEDVSLRGGDPRDSTRPLSIDQVANGVSGLARLHRSYWGFSASTHPALAWVQTWAPTEGFHSALRQRIPLGMERAAARLPAEVARRSADEIVDLWVRYVALLGRDPTLLHADAHIGNTYLLPNDDVGFLDWQVVRRGHWSQDVGYFLQAALVETDRRAAERDLVAAYSKELGCGAGRADACQWYRASPAYGLAIWLSTLGTDGYQRHEISLELVARYAAAFVELETLDALTALEPAPIAAVRGLAVMTLDGLREITAGELEMQTTARAIDSYRDVITSWATGALGVVMPGGSSGHEFLDRFDEAVRTLEDAGTRVAAVSHGAAIRTWIAARCLDVDAAMVSGRGLANTSVAIIEGSTCTGWQLIGWLEEVVGDLPATGLTDAGGR